MRAKRRSDDGAIALRLPLIQGRITSPDRRLSDTLRAIDLSISSGEAQLSVEQLRWLRAGLMAIGNGEQSAPVAFGLENSVGRAAQPDRGYLMTIEQLALERQVSRKGDAYDATARRWSVTAERVRQVKRDYLKAASTELERWLAQAAAAGVSEGAALARLYLDLRHLRKRRTGS